MYTVYFAYGHHAIRHYTAEEFERIKDFYKLRLTNDNKWVNGRGDIFGWKEEMKHDY